MEAFSENCCAIVAYMDDIRFIIGAPTRALVELREAGALNVTQNWETNDKKKSMSLTLQTKNSKKRTGI